jgi:hypothetical protein
MIDWIKHTTHLGNSQFFYLEYLTLSMCFGIGDYNHMSVVKKSLRSNTAHTVAEILHFWLPSQ